MATAVAPWISRLPALAARPAEGAPARARGVRPLTLVHAVIALLLVSNLGRLPALWLLGQELPVLPQEVVLVFTLLVAAAGCLQARRLRTDGVIGTAALFTVIGIGAAVATAVRIDLELAELAYALAYLLRWVTYMGLYVAVVNVARAEDAEGLWATLERTMLAFAAFGIVQAVAIPGFAQRVYPSDSETLAWDTQGNRLVSSVLDPNYAGAMILLPLLVILGRMAFGVRVPLWKPLTLLAALVLTASRSSILGLAVGALVVLAARGLQRRVVRLGAIAVAIGLPFTPLLIAFGNTYEKFGVSDGSALTRLEMWARGITILFDHPVFGIGFNTFGYVQADYGWEVVGRDAFGIDGGLLLIAVLTGGVGLAVYLGMLGVVVRGCRRLWRDAGASPAVRGTALGVAAGVPALCVHSVFSNSLLLPWIIEMVAVLWAVVHLMRRGRADELAAGAAAAARLQPLGVVGRLAARAPTEVR